MKPGNLLIQGAKSGGKREMRIRYRRTSNLRCAVFYVIAPFKYPVIPSQCAHCDSLRAALRAVARLHWPVGLMAWESPSGFWNL